MFPISKNVDNYFLNFDGPWTLSQKEMWQPCKQFMVANNFKTPGAMWAPNL